MIEKQKQLIEVIAIDGPAASGKSTVGLMLSQRLNYLFLDTGIMYRAVTLAVLTAGFDPADENRVVAVARAIEIDVDPADPEQSGRHYTVWLNGKDVTRHIRSPEVDANVSAVSSYKAVREVMVNQQRQIAANKPVVMVGRDIGTVVLPDAPLKLYVTASAEERARRRLADRLAGGVQASYEEILADIKRRDKIDSEREHAPLKPAADAILIDTSELEPEEVVDHIMNLAVV